jgi:hypothetical protein
MVVKMDRQYFFDTATRLVGSWAGVMVKFPDEIVPEETRPINTPKAISTIDFDDAVVLEHNALVNSWIDNLMDSFPEEVTRDDWSKVPNVSGLQPPEFFDTIPNSVFPYAILRMLLSSGNLVFQPSRSPAINRFFDKYSDWILAR